MGYWGFSALLLTLVGMIGWTISMLSKQKKLNFLRLAIDRIVLRMKIGPAFFLSTLVVLMVLGALLGMRSAYDYGENRIERFIPAFKKFLAAWEGENEYGYPTQKQFQKKIEEIRQKVLDCVEIHRSKQEELHQKTLHSVAKIQLDEKAKDEEWLKISQRNLYAKAKQESQTITQEAIDTCDGVLNEFALFMKKGSMSQREVDKECSRVRVWLISVCEAQQLHHQLSADGTLIEPRKDTHEGSKVTDNSRHIVSCFFNALIPNLPEMDNWSFRISGHLIAAYLGYLLIAGLSVSLFYNILRNYLRNVEYGSGRDYSFLKRHHVIIGARKGLWRLILSFEEKEEPFKVPSYVPKFLNEAWRYYRGCRHAVGNKLREIDPFALFARRGSILILTSLQTKEIYADLEAHLSAVLMKKIILMHGVLTERATLDKLGIENCHDVHIIGDTLDCAMDNRNMECVLQISNLLKEKEEKRVQDVLRRERKRKEKAREEKRPYVPKESVESKKIKCRVYFDRSTTYRMLQRGAVAPFENIQFEPLCFQKNWTEEVLCVRHPYFPGAENMKSPSLQDQYLPLDRVPITEDSDKYVHFIIIGMSRMGNLLAIEAAQILHFPNFVKKGIRSKITMLDRNADEKVKILHSDYKKYFEYTEWQLGQPSDCPYCGEVGIKTLEQNIGKKIKGNYIVDQEWTFIKGDMNDRAVQRLLAKYAKEENAIVTVAVCVSKESDSTALAVSLPSEYYEKKREIQILARQETGAGLLRALHSPSWREYGRSEDIDYGRVKSFGMRNREFFLRPGTEERALISHLVYTKARDMLIHEDPVYGNYRNLGQWKKMLSNLEKDSQGKDDWEALGLRAKFTNRYRSYMLWSMLRSIKINRVDLNDESGVNYQENKGWELHIKLKNNANLLATVEHNRWVVEELLLGKFPHKKVNENSENVKKTIPYDDLKFSHKSFRKLMILYAELQVEYYLKHLKVENDTGD